MSEPTSAAPIRIPVPKTLVVALEYSANHVVALFPNGRYERHERVASDGSRACVQIVRVGPVEITDGFDDLRCDGRADAFVAFTYAFPRNVEFCPTRRDDEFCSRKAFRKLARLGHVRMIRRAWKRLRRSCHEKCHARLEATVSVRKRRTGVNAKLRQMKIVRISPRE